jgi:hypothetical protein
MKQQFTIGVKDYKKDRYRPYVDHSGKVKEFDTYGEAWDWLDYVYSASSPRYCVMSRHVTDWTVAL